MEQTVDYTRQKVHKSVDYTRQNAQCFVEYRQGGITYESRDYQKGNI